MHRVSFRHDTRLETICCWCFLAPIQPTMRAMGQNKSYVRYFFLTLKFETLNTYLLHSLSYIFTCKRWKVGNKYCKIWHLIVDVLFILITWLFGNVLIKSRDLIANPLSILLSVGSFAIFKAVPLKWTFELNQVIYLCNWCTKNQFLTRNWLKSSIYFTLGW